MQKINKIFFLSTCITPCLSGCAMLGGDMPIRVVGSVPVQGTKAGPSECTLTMLFAESSAVASRQNVPVRFEARFIVEARSKPYYFMADCKDGREYKSKNIIVGGRGSFDRVFDLGMFKEK